MDDDYGAYTGQDYPLGDTEHHEHIPYEFSEEAKTLIREDLLKNLVVALAELDHKDPPELARILTSQAQSTNTSHDQTPVHVDLEVRT